MDNCPPGQIIGAVLGTFFGTLLLCGLLLVALFVIYRRRMAQLQVEMARRQSPVSDTKEKKRMTVAPPIVQAYTNAGFHEQETYESQGTLQVRQPEVVQSSAVPIERSVDVVDLKPTSHDETLKLESILQLTLAQCDCIGRGFQVNGGDSDGVSGGVYVSDVMPEASTLLRTVMKSGDEILSINIELTRRLSASNVRDILRLAADCPVRLTLRGKRRPSSSVPVVHGSDFNGPQLIPTTSRDDGDDNNYHTASERSSLRRSIAESGTGSAAATEHRSPRLSAALTRWNSVPINVVEHRPPTVSDSSFCSNYSATLIMEFNVAVDLPSLTTTMTFTQTLGLNAGYWYMDSFTIDYDYVNGSSSVNETVDIWPYFITETPFGLSYSCSYLPQLPAVNVTQNGRGVNITFTQLQVQAFNISNDEFGYYNDCVGFFNITIWCVLIVLFVLTLILADGVCMMMSLETSDRIDDPKGKTITINASD